MTSFLFYASPLIPVALLVVIGGVAVPATMPDHNNLLSVFQVFHTVQTKQRLTGENNVK